MIEVDTITGPAAWASALVNGDDSSLDEMERCAMETWLAGLGGDSVVDVARAEDGEALEPRFTWNFALYGGTAQGGEVVDYVIHRQGR